MKEIILSADGDSTVWSVPDPVADGLETYCLEFCDHWSGRGTFQTARRSVLYRSGFY